MWIVRVLCIVVGLVFTLGLRSAGRSERAAGVWTTFNKSEVLVAGVIVIVLGSSFSSPARTSLSVPERPTEGHRPLHVQDPCAPIH